MSQLVSILTPTWRRPWHLGRCMTSVAQQTRKPVQHVIVSDGPDGLLGGPGFAEFAGQLERHYPGYEVTVAQLPLHDPDAWWGIRARLRAAELAGGAVIGQCDDDDVLLPWHVELLAGRIEDTGAGFAFSRVWIGPFPRCIPGEQNRIHGGLTRPDPASIHAPACYMFRAELLQAAAWRPVDPPEWDIVERWLAAGVTWGFADRVTAVMYQHDGYTADGYPPHMSGAAEPLDAGCSHLAHANDLGESCRAW